MADDDKLVLIVDDDDKLTKMLQFLFVTKGFTVKSAENGIEALEMLKKNMPDAIILDIMMPEMDGCKFMEKIKADALMKEVPVVVLTAVKSDGNKKQLLSLGAYDYFEKPFKSSELLNRVIKAIEENQVMNINEAQSKLTEGEYSPERQHVRTKVKKKCILRIVCVDTKGSEAIFVETLNHSNGGLSIIYDGEKLSVGNRVLVYIEALNVSKKEAEVVWMKQINEDCTAGLRWS